MSEWKKVKIGDVCKIVKGATGIASAEPGEYPLVVTAVERKTCSTFQFDCEAVCIPLVSSSGHGKKSLNNVHYQSGKFALGTILCAVIPNNSEELDARYLHQYLQFYKDTALVPLMKGAANVSLSMKDIAGVSIPLPPIKRQRELAEMFVTLQEKQKELFAELEKQAEYAKQLRHNILQEAIEGKLTADWRKYHPIIKGNPEYDVEMLFETIQKERNLAKKQKKLPAITDEEKTFEFPEGWKWVRLGEYLDVRDGTHDSPRYVEIGYPFVTSKNLINGSIDFSTCKRISKKDFEKFDLRSHVDNGDILYAMIGSIGNAVIVNKDREFAIKNVALFKKYNALLTNMSFVYYWLCFIEKNLRNNAAGSLQPFISLSIFRTHVFPLPPLAEQKEIVDRVEQYLQTITQLETQIATRETTTKQLMQSILKDAFEEG